MNTLYGINNCDTVKKSQKWLLKNNIDFQFYDFKKQPLTASLLEQFVSLSDWDVLLNKRSTTFRNLPDAIKENLTDKVIFEAVLEQPTLLKRPLLLVQADNASSTNNIDVLHLGFKDAQYQVIFDL
jgi:arsenate reductase